MFKNNKEKEINCISTEEVEKLYEFQRKSFDAKISEQQKKIDELTDYISERFGEDISKNNFSVKLNSMEKEIEELQNYYKTNFEKIKNEFKKQIKRESEKIATELNNVQTESYFIMMQKNENDLEKIQNIIAENKDNNQKIIELEDLINKHIENYDKYKTDTQKELDKANNKISKINYTGITNKFGKKIKEECSKLENKIVDANEKIENDVIKHSENIANLVGCLDERHSTEIALTKEQLENIAIKFDTTKEKNSKDISGLNNKIKEIIENNKANLNELELIKEKNISEINEQKTHTENIDSAIDIINNTMESNYEQIGKELLKLREETELNFEKSKNNTTNIEMIKKDYNKYVTKMNNELGKLTKNIADIQKKNLETNQKLQVKIKNYIDNKITKTDNTKKIEELVGKLNLSIQEREKAQRLEIETEFNKKLRAIQKENERVLREKIEEINSKFIKQNSSYEKINPNNVTFYNERPTKNKDLYELIDNNQILRKSAKSKNNSLEPQQNKTQILKFFYDKDD